MEKVNPVLHRLNLYDEFTSLKNMSEGNAGALSAYRRGLILRQGDRKIWEK